MSVYCIYLGNDIYFGSTKVPLHRREIRHNCRLRAGNSKAKLYEKARELGINHLECQLLYEGDDYLQIEHELIENNKCLNMMGAIPDRERHLRLHRQAQRRYIERKKAGLLHQN